MQKIKFGYSCDINPKGSWEGIGIKPGEMLTEAEYVGSFGYDGNNYIVAQIMDSESFIVRDCLLDMYPDGSGVIFLNQEQSIVSKKVEEIINSEKVKSKINSINDVIRIFDKSTTSNRYFKLFESDDELITTSILPDVFNLKNDAIKNCHSTFSELEMTVEERYGR